MILLVEVLPFDIASGSHNVQTLLNEAKEMELFLCNINHSKTPSRRGGETDY